ncbi:hypothetical protein [Burkholderia pseudomallei]|uniref:hypothetical protein n=1 Tax=Burkholderia pseudomallei TaxID=28450 RepID=UPI0012FE5AAE|nr:hypothetical protein [Burkholderia pseudomallei]
MNNLSYVPGVYEALAATELGKRIWIFLNESENRLRMRTASDLGRPALEALEEPLLERFRQDVLPDRVKQMIGHMARQVMEAEGYVIDAQHVKLTGGAPFSRATRYKRPNAVVFHIWRSSDDPRSVALTPDRVSDKLPVAEHEEWRYWKTVEGPVRASVLLYPIDLQKAKKDIGEQGYHLLRVERLLRARQ